MAYKSPRQAAYSVLTRVFGGGAYADILLEEALGDLSEKDRALATELTYGVLRNFIRIDWIIDFFSSIKTKKLEHSVLNALRIGAYQLLFLTRVPASAAINESVKLIKPLGAKKAGFVNAVLRRLDRERDSVIYPPFQEDPVRHISILYSHPEWMIKRWARRWGIDEAAALCKANLSAPPKTLRVNTLAVSRDELMEEFGKVGVEARKTLYCPDGIEILEGNINPKDPKYYMQDEASQLIARLVAPSSGERILDACAAPGGKTTHMAQLMGNSGAVYALDKYAARLKTLKDAAERLNISIVKVIAADSEARLPFKAGTPGPFDAILIDAPCSGLGVLRRAPDIKMRRLEAEIDELSMRQMRLIGNLSPYLKKGGRIVYSACTFEPEETDEIIKGFLKTHSGFELEDASKFLPPGCGELADKDGFLRTLPHRHGIDGFFAARLRRV